MNIRGGKLDLVSEEEETVQQMMWKNEESEESEVCETNRER